MVTAEILVEYILRPFAKIFEKFPYIALFLLVVIYGSVAYVVIRSAYFSEER